MRLMEREVLVRHLTFSARILVTVGFGLCLVACGPQSSAGPRDHDTTSPPPTADKFPSDTLSPNRVVVAPDVGIDDPAALADASKWHMTVDNPAYYLMARDKYEFEHGDVNDDGLPLAGGGVVGRDDWRTININGRPTPEQIMRKRRREALFSAEMPKRDPIADARAAAARGDWRFYMTMANRPYPGAGDYRPIEFLVSGLDDIFGCAISEAEFRQHGRRSLFSYYDLYDRLYVPGYLYGAPSEAIRLTGWTGQENIPLVLIVKYQEGFNKELLKIARSKGEFIFDLLGNRGKCVPSFPP